MLSHNVLLAHFCQWCRYVLKNMVRDWGEEGAEERAQSYGRILAEVHMRLPVRAFSSHLYNQLDMWC